MNAGGERMRRVRGWCAAAVLAMLGASGVAGAQDGGSDREQGGPPVRAVRLTFVQGAVTVTAAPGDDDAESQPAQVNQPMLAGAQLATETDGQAEVEFEDGSVVRLTPNSTLALDTLRVDRDGTFTTGMTLLRGLAYVELRATAQYRYTVRAGADMLTPVENVTARVDFDEPPAVFAVLDGTAAVSREEGSMRREVRAGESLRFDPGGAGQLEVAQGFAQDTWEAWNSDRDQAESAEASDATPVRGEFAGEQGYGWSDLDANGTWYDAPGEGQVWQPTVAFTEAGFDPYGFGSWVFYPNTGYVWASGYGWGWTPYRCGNWSYFGGFGWGWSPAGCGGLGWRFAGGGRPVNVVLGPGGYRVPHVPHPHPGPVHPIVPGRLDGAGPPTALAGVMGWGTAVQRGPRQINGVVVTPVVRTGTAGLRAGTGPAAARPVASALDRDFPMDHVSRTAIVGRVPAQAAAVSPGTGAGSVRSYTGQSGAAVFRGQTAGETRPAYPAGQGEVERSSGGQAQRPAYTPERPTYTPQRPTAAPQGQRPAYGSGGQPGQRPYPTQQVQRPTYAPSPQSRPSPPPAYTPAPRPSSPPSYSPPPSRPAPAPAATPAAPARSGK